MANLATQHLVETVKEEQYIVRTKETQGIIENRLTNLLSEEIEHVLIAEKEVLPQVWIRYL